MATDKSYMIEGDYCRNRRDAEDTARLRGSTLEEMLRNGKAREYGPAVPSVLASAMSHDCAGCGEAIETSDPIYCETCTDGDERVRTNRAAAKAAAGEDRQCSNCGDAIADEDNAYCEDCYDGEGADDREERAAKGARSTSAAVLADPRARKAYRETLAQVRPPKTTAASTPSSSPAAVELTPEEKHIAARMGLDEADVLATKRAQLEKAARRG